MYPKLDSAELTKSNFITVLGCFKVVTINYPSGAELELSLNLISRFLTTFRNRKCRDAYCSIHAAWCFFFFWIQCMCVSGYRTPCSTSSMYMVLEKVFVNVIIASHNMVIIHLLVWR